MWIIFALSSAVFAALATIFIKAGLGGVDSNLATAVRTAIVLVFASIIALATMKPGAVAAVGHRNWLFLVLSGIATGASWLCYNKALQIGAASKVMPVDKLSLVIGLVLAFIFLKEPAAPNVIIGAIIITIGTLVVIF